MKRGAPMKRTAFARKTTAENIPSKVAQSHSQRAPVAVKSIAKMTPRNAPINRPINSEFRGSIPKSQPVRNEAYRRLVAALPCVICGIAGQSQAAHGSGAGTAVCKGMGIKSCDLTCAPFCVPHHQQLDQGAMFSKTVRHALEPDWAADTQRRIHAMGKWPKGIPYPQKGQK